MNQFDYSGAPAALFGGKNGGRSVANETVAQRHQLSTYAFTTGRSRFGEWIK